MGKQEIFIRTVWFLWNCGFFDFETCHKTWWWWQRQWSVCNTVFTSQLGNLKYGTPFNIMFQTKLLAWFYAYVSRFSPYIKEGLRWMFLFILLILPFWTIVSLEPHNSLDIISILYHRCFDPYAFYLRIVKELSVHICHLCATLYKCKSHTTDSYYHIFTYTHFSTGKSNKQHNEPLRYEPP